MLAIQVVENRINGLGKGNGVAEHAVIETRLQSVEDLGRRGEIHVCYPEREDVFACILVPLKGAIARALRAAVKIVNRFCHEPTRFDAR